MNPFLRHLHTDRLLAVTRRQFFGKCAVGIGSAALASLLNEQLMAAASKTTSLSIENSLAPKRPHFAPRAKRAIYLHMAGSPSQLDLFDFKPKLVEMNGKDCPESIYKKERFAFIKGVPRMLGTPHTFSKHGQSGIEMSEILPHLATVADDLCVIRSMATDQFNHAP